ncbi:MAG: PKD domain-containing protein [Elusimicrobiota bacterium]
MNDFAARMDWCVKPFNQANHAPVAVVNGALSRTVTSGQTVTLDASGSSDPDGNALSYNWWRYLEASGYKGALAISNGAGAVASFTAPNVVSPQTIHIILEVKDAGAPNLVAYQRVVVTVNPAGTSTPPQMTSPAAGTVLSPNQTVTATGTGTNLSWSIDRTGDGLGAFKTGTGPSITFTVPADATSTQTIVITLTGSGGTLSRSYAISGAPATVPSAPRNLGRR